MLIFTVGDVVAEGGIRILERTLRSFKKLKGIHFTIVNGENAAGMGITGEQAERIFNAGADVITLGNHAFSKREMLAYVEDERYILRPENLTHVNPGRGYGVFIAENGKQVGLLCLIGRVFMQNHADNPFYIADRHIEKFDTNVILVEIHGEATSEKAALAWYLDGRVSAVYGTHTHVQTADERVLPKGTGFITDLGMTGPINSILGMEPQSSVDRLLGHPQISYKSAKGPCMLQGALFEIDDNIGRCISVERITLE
ncbi:MAG: YmdB family metallophosphoesterase [Clostridiales bacterium]|jgi:metallophosphoesterase (TIGR00282 family)|nr:YmdB family metallophosphoesterase [Clostridiales bacterium]